MARKRVKKKARRIATFGFVSIILIISLSSILLKLFLDIKNKYMEKKELENKLVELQEEKDNLQTDVKKLQNPEYLARYAREKYFYSKDGELIIRIPSE